MANTQYAVPEKLIAVLLPEFTRPQDYSERKFRARPAFVVDALYPRLLIDARKWGESMLQHPPFKNAVIEEVELDNTPISQITVVGVEHRREGGVAFKVITEQGWLVDFREEEFMEAALTGTLVSGAITGQFVWTRGIGQMRLVRVGDTTYNQRKPFGNGVKP